MCALYKSTIIITVIETNLKQIASLVNLSDVLIGPFTTPAIKTTQQKASIQLKDTKLKATQTKAIILYSDIRIITFKLLQLTFAPWCLIVPFQR